jgi:hypothetical protein
VSLTPEAGANDAMVAVRVVPAGRDGNRVFGRTLAPDEPDSGEALTFFPYAGEELHFPAGSVQIVLRDVDRTSPGGPDGYAPVANTLWTWLMVGAPPDPALLRFLFACARRLDTAHALYANVVEALTGRPDPFIKARHRVFAALGQAELMCVALGRAIDMMTNVPSQLTAPVVLPAISATVTLALREIRNAFEHIEDRAVGNVRGKPHVDALSIFDQRDLISHGVLRYAAHSLDLRTDVFPMLIEVRRAVLNSAIAASGSGKSINVPLAFPSAPPGSYERILERAYFLWENRSGSAWWDAESNWAEAERNDAALQPRGG